MTARDPLDGWIPFYLKRGLAHWGYMGRERFVEPFFQSTVQKLAARPFNQVFCQQTGLDALVERAATHPGLPLRGLVFHMSRCGSTLAAQALAALPDTVVLSEPPPSILCCNGCTRRPRCLRNRARPCCAGCCPP